MTAIQFPSDLSTLTVDEFIDSILNGTIEIPLESILFRPETPSEGVWKPTAFISIKNLHNIYDQKWSERKRHCGMHICKQDLATKYKMGRTISKKYKEFFSNTIAGKRGKTWRGFTIKSSLFSSIHVLNETRSLRISQHIKERIAIANADDFIIEDSDEDDCSKGGWNECVLKFSKKLTEAEASRILIACKGCDEGFEIQYGCKV